MRGFVVILALAACDPEPDPSEGDNLGLPEICLDAPLVTWDVFGAGFVTQSCQACHASTSPDRRGAPDEVVFDSEEDVWTWADRILVRAVGDAPTMPPEGGVDEDERYLLEVWLTCGG